MKIYELLNERGFIPGASSVGKLLYPYEKFKSVKDYAPRANTKQGAMSLAARESEYLLKIPIFGRTLHRSKIKDAAKQFELARANQAAARFNNFGAGFMNIITFLGVGNAVIDYYAAVEVVEKSDLSDEEKQTKLNELAGILTIQVIGAGLISKSAQISTVVTKIVPLAAKFIPGTTIPKLGIAASEVANFIIRMGASSLIAIFTSEKGKEIIRDFIASWIINPIGWVVRNAAKFLEEVYEYAKAGYKYSQGYRAPDKDTPAGSPQAAGADKTSTPSTNTSKDSAADSGDIMKTLMDPDANISDIAAKMAMKSMGLSK